jgi:hypothetical protein
MEATNTTGSSKDETTTDQQQWKDPYAHINLPSLNVEWKAPEIFIAGPSRTGAIIVSTPNNDPSLLDLIVLELVDSTKFSEIREAIWRIQKCRENEPAHSVKIRFSLCSKTKWQMEYRINTTFCLRLTHPSYRPFLTRPFKIVARMPRKKQGGDALSGSQEDEDLTENERNALDVSASSMQNVANASVPIHQVLTYPDANLSALQSGEENHPDYNQEDFKDTKASPQIKRRKRKT